MVVRGTGLLCAIVLLKAFLSPFVTYAEFMGNVVACGNTLRGVHDEQEQIRFGMRIKKHTISGQQWIPILTLGLSHTVNRIH